MPRGRGGSLSSPGRRRRRPPPPRPPSRTTRASIDDAAIQTARQNKITVCVLCVCCVSLRRYVIPLHVIRQQSVYMY
jgi:hypothetical protein